MDDARWFRWFADGVPYASLDIRVRPSDSKSSRGHLARQGPPLLRWGLYEAAMSATHASSPDHAYYKAVKAAHKDDGEIALISVARKLARRCYHTLRELGEGRSQAA